MTAVPTPRCIPLLVLTLLGSITLEAASAPLEVDLAFVGTPNSAAHRGALQGIDEAQQQGEFLGQRYALNVAPGAAADQHTTAIIAAVSDDELNRLAAEYPSIPILNVTQRADALRADCRANLLHVIPSLDMRARAVAQWRQANPDAGDVQAQAWHPAFEKYAAAQLNNRYHEKYGLTMDDEAWSGWAAVKLVSDMIARSETADSAKVLAAIREQLAFDGQKGVGLSFAPNGQLRQPLLLVADGKLIGEAPVRGVVDIEDLDSLNVISCAK